MYWFYSIFDISLLHLGLTRVVKRMLWLGCLFHHVYRNKVACEIRVGSSFTTVLHHASYAHGPKTTSNGRMGRLPRMQ
jgi:hypothetical protein